MFFVVLDYCVFFLRPQSNHWILWRLVAMGLLNLISCIRCLTAAVLHIFFKAVPTAFWDFFPDNLLSRYKAKQKKIHVWPSYQCY